MFVSRWALEVEYYVHPLARDELTKYFTKLTTEERPGVLTDGIWNYGRTAITELMRICLEKLAPCLLNCFGNIWKAFAFIHPENGTFPSQEILSALLTKVRGTWDVLQSNLTKSDTSESGEVLDATAYDFC